MGNQQNSYSLQTVDVKYLSEESIQSICESTKMSKEDIIKCHQNFLEDVPSGKLDRNSFTKVYKSLYPNGDATQYCKIIFDVYDQDKNGFIEFNEFVNALGIAKSNNIDEKLNLAFNLYDVNRDGQIEKKEAEVILKSLFKLYGEKVSHNELNKLVDRLIKNFDLDGNGSLSREEFLSGCKNDDELRQLLASSVAM